MNVPNYYLFFTNLSNKLKMSIIFSLREGEKNVTRIVKELGVEQSKVSHALSSLKCYKIVNVKRNGKQRIYSLNKETIVPILKIIDKHKDNFCVNVDKK